MRTTVNLDADVHSFASNYADAKRITLSAAISELIRRAEHAPEPPSPSSRLRMNEYGYYEVVGPGEIITLEMVKELSEDPVD